MKTLRCSIWLLSLIALPSIGISQEFQLTGTVLDKETHQPIEMANIILKNSTKRALTNDQGFFLLDLNSFPADIYIRCMGYVEDTVVISSKNQLISSFKNSNIEILLEHSTIQINEVQIIAQNTLFEKDPYSIIDYKIFRNRILAVGFKHGNPFKKEILLADLSGKLIGSEKYRRLDSLFQDCQGNVFVCCADSALELGLIRDSIIIKNRYQRSFITKLIVPVCSISDSLIYLKKSSANHQYDNYFAVRDSQDALFVYSTGGFFKESQVLNIKKLWKTQAGTPITINNIPSEGKAWAEFLNYYDGIYQNGFTSQLKLRTDYHSVFTKMITFGKNQLIFDREAATIVWLDEKGSVIKEISMNNKLDGLYYQNVHKDDGTGKIFIEYSQGPRSYFVEINPETGQEVRHFMVRNFRYIEKCSFFNGRLYFLNQPDNGKQFKKLCSIWI